MWVPVIWGHLCGRAGVALQLDQVFHSLESLSREGAELRREGEKVEVMVGGGKIAGEQREQGHLLGQGPYLPSSQIRCHLWLCPTWSGVAICGCVPCGLEWWGPRFWLDKSQAV